jgi:hypothetical protein
MKIVESHIPIFSMKQNTFLVTFSIFFHGTKFSIPKRLSLVNVILSDAAFLIMTQFPYVSRASSHYAGPKEGLKISGGWGASRNVVGIICPLGGIGLTYLPKSWGGGQSPRLGDPTYPTPHPPGPTALSSMQYRVYYIIE